MFSSVEIYTLEREEASFPQLSVSCHILEQLMNPDILADIFTSPLDPESGDPGPVLHP